jgi:type II secretory pathway component PulM
MKKYFSQLRPLERRLVIGVGVVVLIVLNWWFVWPHFSDWSNLSNRLDNASRKLKSYQTLVAQTDELKRQLKNFESAGEIVAPEDQAINFMRTIQSQASASGFGIQNYSRSMMRTNEFFVEQVQNITVLATEPQLVDFLYKLGSGASMVRVRDLELQPDPARQRLAANIRLVASYQINPNPATAANNSTAKAK